MFKKLIRCGSFLFLIALLSGAIPPRLSAQRVAEKNSKAEVLQLDLLIRGGKVVDGSGGAPKKADVGIRGDRIVFIGKSSKKNISAARTLDASEMIVAPGFIDPHTHALEDLFDSKLSANENYLMQGVTTVITGNDGDGPLNVAETLGKWTRQGIGTNAGLLVGHGSVRRSVMGNNDVQPSNEQLERMKAVTGQAISEGAFGISTGLFYAPGSFAATEEIIEIAKIVAENGGIYDTHMRDEGSYSIGLLGSIEETIRIAREAKIPVHISHIKALGTDVWGQSKQAVRLIKKARAGKLKVTANQYPYTASGTNLTAALVPRWAEAGGAARLLERIADQNLRARLVAEMEANLKRRNGAEAILITRSRDRQLIGKTLGGLAAERKKTPVETALEIIANGGAGIASFNMSDKDIENFMKQSFVMTGSDGSGGHPRKYGTFPRKLRQYVFTKKMISLPFAIRAGTSLTAETFGITERGLLRVGYFADIIVFDPKVIADRATYEQPEKLAVGMKYVLVNGEIAVAEGSFTGKLAGRALRKSEQRRIQN